MAIDKTMLPDRPLLDTSVLIRALGDRPGDPEAPVCQELVEALSDRGASILIAAPSVAEITRKRGAALPRANGIEVVAFDDLAAQILGAQFPVDVIKEVQGSVGSAPSGYIKYDAMIVACAVRHRATCIVSLDKGMQALSSRLSAPIACRRPDFYVAAPGSVVEMRKAASPQS